MAVRPAGHDAQAPGAAHALQRRQAHLPELRKAGACVGQPIGTVAIGIEASLTGHLVLTTVHANNVFDVFGRFTHMGIDPYSFVSALNGVVAQRLVRVNCPHCSEPTVPSLEQLADSGLSAEAAARGEAAPKRPKRKSPLDPRHFKAATPGALIVCPKSVTHGWLAETARFAPDLGIAASKQALIRAAIDPIDIDLVVCATATPNRPVPNK